MFKQDLADTIVALSTLLGESGIGVIRLSGSNAVGVVDSFIKILGKSSLQEEESHRVSLAKISDSENDIDEVMVVKMISPQSYTGEDVVEISCHGNPLILQKVIQLSLSAGARLAFPGEFTQRAFLNGKKDLTQAEAVADLIHSQSDQAVARSLRQLEGSFSKPLRKIKDKVENLLLYLEAELDFSEEAIDFLTEDIFVKKIQELLNDLNGLCESFERSTSLRQGVSIVFAGRPNVGKSSVFNALLKTHRSIVTPIAGTTRDSVDAWITLQGIPFRLVDTAGLRESDDLVEQEGVRRSLLQLQSADLVIFLWDASEITQEDHETLIWVQEHVESERIFSVINKWDVQDSSVIQTIKELSFEQKPLMISAQTGEHLGELEELLIQKSGVAIEDSSSDLFINERQKKLLDLASFSIKKTGSLPLNQNQELIVCDLKEAARALSEILGEVFDEDILSKIFSSFCIGK